MRFKSHFQGMAGSWPSAPAVLAIILLLLCTQGWSTGVSAQSQPSKAKAPDARFRTLSGDTLLLNEFRGKPVLLSFWSTSCAICIQEMPEMKRLYHALKNAGADMISITMPYDPPNHVVEATTNHSLPFPVAIDLDGSLTRAFDIAGTPMKILVSPEGKIIRTFLGALDYQKTLGAVTDLMVNQ